MKASEAKKKWLSDLSGLWPAAKGSVRQYQQKCTKKDCQRCASGVGHPVWQLTYYDADGRQKSKHVPRERIADFRLALENGRKIEALLVCCGLEYLEELKKK
jgi:hypothetical protein